jgi:GH24 family phage-related lysozyme (muramidase)
MADTVLRLNDRGANVIEAQDLLNRNGAILDADGVFGGETEKALREFQAASHLDVTGVIDAATLDALRALPEPSPDIPTRAVAFIGREEVGSRQGYDQSCSKPTWPGGASGVTIGVGYDLGYQPTFDVDWADVLTVQQMAALRPWLGVQGDPAKSAPGQLVAVVIPWPAAWTVFIRRTLPQNVTLTRSAFTEVSEMPPLCFGVLVSLIYNRGPSMTDSPKNPGNRREMRDIRQAVIDGRLQDIPAALRSMKRLWPPDSGLWMRREREARLFEDGLAQSHDALRASK